MDDSTSSNGWDDDSGWNVGDDWESIGVDNSVNYYLLKIKCILNTNSCIINKLNN